jgi:Cys-rich repeat protein
LKTSRLPLAALLLFCSSAPLLHGCGAGVDDATSADDLNQSRRRCTNDAGCYNGYVCVSGFCTKPAACHSDKDCPHGEVCKNGKCQNPPPPPPPSQCTANSNCPSGEVCVGGACQACTATSQCDAGLVCNGGSCQTPPPPPSGGCQTEHDCSNGALCESGSCVASACNQRASGKTGIRAQVQITRYQGLISGRNGSHEIAYGTLTNVEWIYSPSTEDTTKVQLAMNVASSTDPSGLPHEILLSVGQTIEVEGEYISAASANASGNAVIHFTHSTCGYVTINGTTYQ